MRLALYRFSRGHDKITCLIHVLMDLYKGVFIWKVLGGGGAK